MGFTNANSNVSVHFRLVIAFIYLVAPKGAVCFVKVRLFYFLLAFLTFFDAGFLTVALVSFVFLTKGLHFKLVSKRVCSNFAR